MAVCCEYDLGVLDAGPPPKEKRRYFPPWSI
jgi:hypothetical protein